MIICSFCQIGVQRPWKEMINYKGKSFADNQEEKLSMNMQAKLIDFRVNFSQQLCSNMQEKRRTSTPKKEVAFRRNV